MLLPIPALSRTLIVLCMVSPWGLASQVYKQVDEEGVVHFSDQPTADSTEVEVDPNVIEVAPVPEIEPLPSTPRHERATEPLPVTQPAPQTLEDDDNYYYDGTAWRRRQVIKQRLQERPVTLPVRPGGR